MKKVGNQTILFNSPPTITSTASIVGPKEKDGPLSKYFDMCIDDEFWGESTWEKAEAKIVKETVNTVINKSKLPHNELDLCFAGDLLNQCISSSFGLRELNIPFYGLFGACSTFVEALSIASVFAASNVAKNIICAASSHFCSAEKQFRFPLELGTQRPPTAQWTVTGSGAAIVSSLGSGPYITSITTGKIIDMGIKDANNMGAAMAMAALDTMASHFKDTGRSPNYYDLILTGDLGHVGKEILQEQMLAKGYNINNNYNDCGVLIFDKDSQDTHSGGSGCGCVASVFSGYVFEKLKEKKFSKVLILGTGALTNATTTAQGESIPGVAHAMSVEV